LSKAADLSLLNSLMVQGVETDLKCEEEEAGLKIIGKEAEASAVAVPNQEDALFAEKKAIGSLSAQIKINSQKET